MSQLELPLGEADRDVPTWAPQRHTHPAQMVLKRCGKLAEHTSHPYLDDAGLNFGCDGHVPESRRCPHWPCPDGPHVWALARGGIYDCPGKGTA